MQLESVFYVIATHRADSWNEQTMSAQQRVARLANGISLEYIDKPEAGTPRGVIVLLHGFPQTAYQFRHVIDPLSEKG